MDFVHFLEKEFQKRLKKNSSYSIRAYARDIGIDQSSLTKVLGRKRTVTESFVKKAGLGLKVPAAKLKNYLSKPKNVVPPSYHELDHEKFVATSDWYHDAILELIDTKDFVSSLDWISKRLGVSKILISSAVERLQKVGLLEIDSCERWRDASKVNSILPEKDSTLALKTLQKQILSLSEKSIDSIPIKERSHTSNVFSASPEKLEEAKALIEDCRRKVAEILRSGSQPKTEVFQLQISLFPLTRRKGGKK